MGFEKNTAAPLPFVLIVASTGNVLTGASPVARRVLDGGVQAVCNGAVSELAGGQYLLDGQAGDFNADDTVGFLFTAATAIPAHLLVQMGRFHKNIAYDIPFRLITIATGAATLGASPAGKRCIDGGAQENVGGIFVERGNGQYVYEGVGADFNGDDTVGFLFTVANSAPVHITIDIEPALVVAGNTLKAKIYSILTTDAIINDPSYLGGMLNKTTTSPYGVFYRNAPDKPDLPVLTYSIISEVQRSGSTEFNPRDLLFAFTAWGNNFEDILRRVFELLQKRREIDASDYSVKRILFEGSSPELWDTDLKVYYRQDTYRIITAKLP